MMKLLKLEWSKFSKYTTVQLLALFFLLFFPASMYLANNMPKLPSFLPTKDVFFQFPSIWEYLGYAGNWMVFFFLGVMTIYTITSEVSNKTMRQSIINGMSRQSFFLSKVLTAVCISLFATLYYSVIALTLGLLNSDGYSLLTGLENEWAIPRFFLMSLGYTSFALFLAFLFRKSGIALFVYITYVLMIEPIIRTIHNWIFETSLTRFYPMNAIEDLMPLPFYKYAEFLAKDDAPNFMPIGYDYATMLTLGYLAVWLGMAYYLFIKRDL
jgi:ABC-2 type transport system permease protein